MLSDAATVLVASPTSTALAVVTGVDTALEPLPRPMSAAILAVTSGGDGGQ